MNEQKASRTLVKSPPELWAECSDAASLTRHLDQFGEIKITRLEPETAVAWEGERVSGTVRLEPSGWGTRVTLTVTPEAVPVEVEEPPAVVDEPEPVAVEAPVVVEEPVAPPPVTITPSRRGGLLGRLLGLLAPRPVPAPPVVVRAPEPVREPVVAHEPMVVAEPPAPEPIASELADLEAALGAALDSLGQAHHRPFSRA